MVATGAAATNRSGALGSHNTHYAQNSSRLASSDRVLGRLRGSLGRLASDYALFELAHHARPDHPLTNVGYYCVNMRAMIVWLGFCARSGTRRKGRTAGIQAMHQQSRPRSQALSDLIDASDRPFSHLSAHGTLNGHEERMPYLVNVVTPIGQACRCGGV